MVKSLIYSLLLLLLFAFPPCDSKSEEKIISKSITAANDYLNALKNNHVDEVMRFYPEVLIESYGEDTLKMEIDDGLDLYYLAISII